MTLGELIDEAEKLTRPCLHLSGGGGGDGPVVGHWGGERSDHPNAVPPTATALASNEHVFSLDGGTFAVVDPFMAARHIGLPLSLFLTTCRNGVERPVLRRNPDVGFGEIACSGAPLRAAPGRSFPPFEAVCLFGSDAVGQWLCSQGFERHRYTQAYASCLGDGYTQIYLRRSSFHASGADIVIGGWQRMWPDDDFFMPQEMRILATTLRDGDPHYELWLTPDGNVTVRSRLSS